MSVTRGPPRLCPQLTYWGRGQSLGLSNMYLKYFNIAWYSENISPATYKRARPPRLGLCPQLSSGGWGDGASASVETVDTAHCGFRGVAGTQLQASPLPCPPDFTFLVVGISQFCILYLVELWHPAPSISSPMPTRFHISSDWYFSVL